MPPFTKQFKTPNKMLLSCTINTTTTALASSPPWGHAVLFTKHLGFFLEVPLQRLSKALPPVVGLSRVSLLLRPQRCEHLGLAVAGAFLYVDKRLQTPLFLDDGSLFPTQGLQIGRFCQCLNTERSAYNKIIRKYENATFLSSLVHEMDEGYNHS